MLSPAYGYAAVQTTDIFMSRADIREKFREAVTLLDKHNLMVSPIYLDFCGERELECTAWGTPTFNPRGWKGPCYVITDNHYDSYREMIDKTPWEKYGPGNDPRCADCHHGLTRSILLRDLLPPLRYVALDHYSLAFEATPLLFRFPPSGKSLIYLWTACKMLAGLPLSGHHPFSGN